MAIIPVPRILPRIIKIDVPRRGMLKSVSFSDIIQRYVGRLSCGTAFVPVPFRITRNSDLYIDEEEVENLRAKSKKNY